MTAQVLIAKELREQLRTHKLTVVAAGLLALGLLSPITAKMLPEMLKSAAGEMQLSLPQPTALFAVDQFVKNLTQMGMLIIVLTAMGAVAGERERGTAAMILCKPVSRAAFIAAKFIAYSIVLAAGVGLGALACYFYTAVLFEPLDPAAFTAASGLLGVYLLVILSLTLLASAVFRSALAAGGLAFGLAIALSLVGGLPQAAPYGPGALPGWGRALLAGVDVSAWPALIVSFGIAALCAVLSWIVFRGQEL